jgi:hypothetical protein
MLKGRKVARFRATGKVCQAVAGIVGWVRWSWPNLDQCIAPDLHFASLNSFRGGEALFGSARGAIYWLKDCQNSPTDFWQSLTFPKRFEDAQNTAY